jgi:uncharacterized OsmC-like protein
MNATMQNTTEVNGIDVQYLRESIEAMSQDPKLAMTRWNVTTRWMGGTRSDTDVKSYEIGGRLVEKDFRIRIDEPLELAGTNQYANPQEVLMAALNACMMVGYAALCAMEGITLEEARIETEGEIDLRGFLGIDPNVAPGYEQLSYRVFLKGDGTPEQFARVHEMVKMTSPNRHNIATAIMLNSQLVVEQ